MQISISYVIPSLNSAKTIEWTLLSLHSQIDGRPNIIVVDSGSTDGTLEICKRWGVKTLYIEPGNMYRAINFGLQQCDTEWMGYINSDDCLYVDSISRLIKRGIEEEAHVVYGNCDFIDGAGRFTDSMRAAKPEQLISLSRKGIFAFSQQTAIFKKKVFDELKGFNENYTYSADADYYLRGIINKFKYSFLDGASVACFRIHGSQLSNAKKDEMDRENEMVFSLTGKSGFKDHFVYLKWKIDNLPHYLLRILRHSLLTGRLSMNRKIQPVIYS